MVRNKLSESGKIEVVAGTDEQKLLDAIKKKSKGTRFSDKASCITGEEMPANSLLRIGGPQRADPLLEMTNAKTGVSRPQRRRLEPQAPSDLRRRGGRLLLRGRGESPPAARRTEGRADAYRRASARDAAPRGSPGGVSYLIEGTDKKGTLQAGEKLSIKLPMRTQPYRVVFEKPGYYPETREVAR